MSGFTVGIMSTCQSGPRGRTPSDPHRQVWRIPSCHGSRVSSAHSAGGPAPAVPSIHASRHSSETGIVALQAAPPCRPAATLVDPTMTRVGAHTAHRRTDRRTSRRPGPRSDAQRPGQAHLQHQMPDRFAPPGLPLSEGATNTRGPRPACRMLPESPCPDAIRPAPFTIARAATYGEVPPPLGAPPRPFTMAEGCAGRRGCLTRIVPSYTADEFEMRSGIPLVLRCFIQLITNPSWRHPVGCRNADTSLNRRRQ